MTIKQRIWMLAEGAVAAVDEEGSPDVVAESLLSAEGPAEALLSSFFTSLRLELGVDELVSFACFALAVLPILMS